MIKLTQLILHFGDKMNVEQKRYAYGQANKKGAKFCHKVPILNVI